MCYHPSTDFASALLRRPHPRGLQCSARTHPRQGPPQLRSLQFPNYPLGLRCPGSSSVPSPRRFIRWFARPTARHLVNITQPWPRWPPPRASRLRPPVGHRATRLCWCCRARPDVRGLDNRTASVSTATSRTAILLEKARSEDVDANRSIWRGGKRPTPSTTSGIVRIVTGLVTQVRR